MTNMHGDLHLTDDLMLHSSPIAGWLLVNRGKGIFSSCCLITCVLIWEVVYSTRNCLCNGFHIGIHEQSLCILLTVGSVGNTVFSKIDNGAIQPLECSVLLFQPTVVKCRLCLDDK